MTTSTITTQATRKFETPAFGLSPGERVIYTVAHPDDEMTMGASIDHLVQHGHQPFFIIATNGEASDRGTPDFLQSGGRINEMKEALSYYGIPASDQLYLGLPDGDLHNKRAIRQLADTVFQTAFTIDAKVFVTMGQDGYDGHRDHQAAHVASVAAASMLRKFPRGESARVYGLTARPAEENFNVDPVHKYRGLSKHASQFTIAAAITAAETETKISARSRELLQRYVDLFREEPYAVHHPVKSYDHINDILAV